MVDGIQLHPIVARIGNGDVGLETMVAYDVIGSVYIWSWHVGMNKLGRKV